MLMSDRFSQPGTPCTEIYEQLAALRLVDPHTHIDPHRPASSTLADLLGYHYYTELAHSAGMAKNEIEEEGLPPKELVHRLVGGLEPLENTVQYSWLISICRTFFGFSDDRLHLNNWEDLYERSESIMASAQWPDMVLDQSNVEAVFLTNDFDDELHGFDTDRYIPCLRTDDLVFHLADPQVRGRLEACSGVALDGSLASLRESLRQRFEHFVSRGARACAISLPPSFSPEPVQDGRASTALDAILRQGLAADASHRDAIARRVFWTLAELCDEFGLPFDLMIGVNRKVYPEGVFQGQDLFDSRVSLIQYRSLFNAFPGVKFPVSVLASVTNQELLSYSWIFPNVYPNGHWWYSNTPSTIHHDLSARLEAVPKSKLIGYYSDAYKLEFVWPKFDMYRKVLANVLTEQFVENRGWSIDRVVELGRSVLKDNVQEIFPRRSLPKDPSLEQETDELVAPAAIGVLGSELAYEEDLGSVDTSDETSVVDSAAGLAGLGLAGIAAGTSGPAAPEFEAPELEAPELEAPELEAPELEAPELEAPELDAPELEAPELEAPELDAPELDAPELEALELEMPEIEPPEFQDADLEIPELATDTPEELPVDSHTAEAEPLGSPADQEVSGSEEIDFETVVIEPMVSQDKDVDESSEPAPSDDPIAGAEPDSDDEDLMSAPSVVDGVAEEVTELADDFGTVVDDPQSKTVEMTVSETVKIDSPLEKDPLPNDDELGELDLDDVELIDPAGAAVLSSGDVEDQADIEPLDVGDLLSEDTDTDQPSPQIEQLRGESSFAPSDELLQLKSDPTTGEFRLDAEAGGDEDDDFNLEFLSEDDET